MKYRFLRKLEKSKTKENEEIGKASMEEAKKGVEREVEEPAVPQNGSEVRSCRRRGGRPHSRERSLSCRGSGRLSVCSCRMTACCVATVRSWSSICDSLSSCADRWSRSRSCCSLRSPRGDAICVSLETSAFSTCESFFPSAAAFYLHTRKLCNHNFYYFELIQTDNFEINIHIQGAFKTDLVDGLTGTNFLFLQSELFTKESLFPFQKFLSLFQFPLELFKAASVCKNAFNFAVQRATLLAERTVTRLRLPALLFAVC